MPPYLGQGIEAKLSPCEFQLQPGRGRAVSTPVVKLALLTHRQGRWGMAADLSWRLDFIHFQTKPSD